MLRLRWFNVYAVGWPAAIFTHYIMCLEDGCTAVITRALRTQSFVYIQSLARKLLCWYNISVTTISSRSQTHPWIKLTEFLKKHGCNECSHYELGVWIYYLNITSYWTVSITVAKAFGSSDCKTDSIRNPRWKNIEV